MISAALQPAAVGGGAGGRGHQAVVEGVLGGGAQIQLALLLCHLPSSFSRKTTKHKED